MEYETYPKTDGTQGYNLKLQPTKVKIGTKITLKCLVDKPSQKKIDAKPGLYEEFTVYNLFMKDEEKDLAINVSIPKGTYFKLLKYGEVLKFKNITFIMVENEVTYTEDSKEITKLVKQFEVEVKSDDGKLVNIKTAGDNINDAFKSVKKQESNEMDLSSKIDLNDDEKSVIDELINNDTYAEWLKFSNKGQEQFKLSYNGVANKMGFEDISDDRFSSVYDYFLSR